MQQLRHWSLKRLLQLQMMHSAEAYGLHAECVVISVALDATLATKSMIVEFTFGNAQESCALPSVRASEAIDVRNINMNTSE